MGDYFHCGYGQIEYSDRAESWWAILCKKIACMTHPLFAGGQLLYIKRPYLTSQTVHSTLLLLVLVGCIRWGLLDGDC